ncbi:hypothetical protein MVLG_04220 [Microbotryum lychnidis-dioicae p1A1 Lamole]|uniref:Enoyl-CoA hydratase n=1 Tax=Microbotryum lychnidis-dioicae (strain p1A1 Lamole / MvSl-1064) TaxID=683840 RepID=U5HAJ5_USTV1|nr:hypothetical protein MVLG_04220 [Microbotryum lychnidis-dioicae p1A1 Lamole]|eukprot:KDE05425.1 hypothetical protein MVLG_04220 [Microbotryum lychnidis-dioicae p1A1 Lamole]
MMPASATKGEPQVGDHLVITYPMDKVMQLRLNKPKALNAMDDNMEDDLKNVLDWFEEEPSLWVCVVTGTGRAFCAGQDLKGWNSTQGSDKAPHAKIRSNPYGFGSIARRLSKKILIAAVNGIALGGGAELLVNCDIVIGVKGGIVGFPEVRRGVMASVGGIPNTYQRSPQLAPYLLTGLNIPPHLCEQHIFTQTVASADQVIPAALEWASKVVECSPDAVQVTKEQINLTKNGVGILDVVKRSLDTELAQATYVGENMKEGLRSFAEKRAPRWNDPPRVGKTKL